VFFPTQDINSFDANEIRCARPVDPKNGQSQKKRLSTEISFSFHMTLSCLETTKCPEEHRLWEKKSRNKRK
jgi:hypothetical protein